MVAKVKQTRSRKTKPIQAHASLLGARSISGQSVDARTTLTLSAVYCAIRLLAEIISTFPVYIYRKTDSGRERIMNHPVSLLLTDPNQEMTYQSLMESSIYHLLTNGNCYWEIERNNGGTPVNLWLTDLFPYRTPLPDAISTRSTLLYKDRQSTTDLDPANVVHIKLLSTDGIIGMSPITQARNSMGNMLSQQEYNSNFYKHGASMSGVVSHPAVLADETRQSLQQNLVPSVSGTENAGRFMLLEGGLTFQGISFSPKDSEFLGQQSWNVQQVSQWFNIPPPLLHDLDRATWGNLDQLSLNFLVYTIQPYLEKIERELERKLLTRQERLSGYYIEHVTENLLRSDPATRMDIGTKGIQYGIFSPNDVAERDWNMPRIPDGDARFIMANLTPIEQALEPPAPAAPPGAAPGAAEEMPQSDK